MKKLLILAVLAILGWQAYTQHRERPHVFRFQRARAPTLSPRSEIAMPNTLAPKISSAMAGPTVPK